MNLIEALTAYTKAWQTTLGCKPNFLGQLICSDEQFKKAADSVTTPLDRRVKTALDAAFMQKGIVTADFPEEVRRDVRMFAGSDFWENEQSPICLPRLRGSANAQ